MEQERESGAPLHPNLAGVLFEKHSKASVGKTVTAAVAMTWLTLEGEHKL